MARKRRDKKRGKQRDARHRKPAEEHAETRPTPRTSRAVLLALAGAGMALTAYLTAVAWLGTTPLYCARESSCDLVQSSRWSTLLGMPMAFWGFVTYALLGGLVWRMRERRAAWRPAAFVACVAVGISLYLTAVSVLVIEATCGYCLASAILMVLVCALLLASKPAALAGFQWRSWAPATAVSTAVVVGLLHMHYSGVFDPAAGPEKPYLKALALHLEERGAKFYGAYWCPRCREQKELFEASASRLPYVECTPDGRGGPISAPCVIHGVDDYPTWIIDGREHVGVLTPDVLARYSGFRWQEDDAR